MSSQNDKELARLIRRQSFEPRYGIAQLVFGVIYAFVAASGAVMSWYILQNTGNHPLMQYFFTVLFGILAAKSFYIFFHSRKLRATAENTCATVEEITGSHGITIVRGSIELNEKVSLLFESKYAGEILARELNRFLKQQKITLLPALLVDKNGRQPKGMFLITTSAGHLEQDVLKEQTDRLKQQFEQKSLKTDSLPAEQTSLNTTGDAHSPDDVSSLESNSAPTSLKAATDEAPDKDKEQKQK